MEGLLGATITADADVEIGPQILNFLQSPWDHGAVTAIQYALTTQLTELVTVPGSGSTDPILPRPPNTIRRGLPRLLLLLRRWFDWMHTVHRLGYSLRGRFNAASFILGMGFQVKMILAAGIHLHCFTRENGGLDYDSFVSSVEELLMLQEAIPPHIGAWLDLIREGVNGNEYLIRYNTALMDPSQAFEFVLDGRLVLEDARVHNHIAFNQVVSGHPEFFNWNVGTNCVNSYMASARNYRDPRGQQIGFARDVTGALTLGRHCSAHPARYLKEFMVLIFEDDFPGAVARFQRNLFRAGLMPGVHLEITMA